MINQSKKEKTYEKRIQMLRNNNYTTGNILDFSNQRSYYKLIGIDLPRQTNTSNSRQNNFTEKLDKVDGATMVLLVKSSKNLF